MRSLNEFIKFLMANKKLSGMFLALISLIVGFVSFVMFGSAKNPVTHVTSIITQHEIGFDLEKALSDDKPENNCPPPAPVQSP